MLDAAVTSLQLEPELLAEGIAATTAATCWYVDLQQQQVAPLLAGHAGRITGLADSGPAGSGGGSIVASMCADGWLALWQTGGGPPVGDQSGR